MEEEKRLLKKLSNLRCSMRWIYNEKFSTASFTHNVT